MKSSRKRAPPESGSPKKESNKKPPRLKTTSPDLPFPGGGGGVGGGGGSGVSSGGGGLGLGGGGDADDGGEGTLVENVGQKGFHSTSFSSPFDMESSPPHGQPQHHRM